MQYIIDSEDLNTEKMREFMLFFSKLLIVCHMQDAETEHNKIVGELFNKAVEDLHKGREQ